MRAAFDEQESGVNISITNVQEEISEDNVAVTVELDADGAGADGADGADGAGGAGGVGGTPGAPGAGGDSVCGGVGVGAAPAAAAVGDGFGSGCADIGTCSVGLEPIAAVMRIVAKLVSVMLAFFIACLCFAFIFMQSLRALILYLLTYFATISVSD